MATMIPENPHEFPPESQEGLMFDAFRQLPDGYYVFHSLRITDVEDNIFHESETDFVIFHADKGIICLEAKAGHVRYQDGYWRYANGTPMHNGGPFNQASSNKWKLKHYIENSKMSPIISRCKFLHAVWFPSVSNHELISMVMPTEADKALVLTKEALEDPTPFIEKIFALELPNRIETSLSKAETQRLIREVLCPQFNVFPSATYDADLKKIVFHRLLKEQAGILNYLDEQKTALINGAAGTGKTMIALEKAQRHAADGEKVLFLCYNAKLRDHLSDNYPHDLIEYHTIAGFACKLCNAATPNYTKLQSLLEDMYLSESFPYQHVIIDEGQDFGMDDIEEANILQTLKDIISDNESKKGTFYVFYDKLQLIQARRMPKFIEEADCKLTLYRNCRNTENIAITSLRPLSERKPKLHEGCVKGVPANFYFASDDDRAIECVDDVIEKLRTDGFKDIVILTCKTEDTSLLSSRVSNGLYQNKYRFTTCRKFKGLEADVIILVDIDETTFNPENVLLYYVGSSRARIRLEVITELTDEVCTDILRNTLNYTGKIKKPKRDLSAALNALGHIAN
jgi:hypothetical protein